MPATAINCLHPGLKSILVHEAASHIQDGEERRIFIELVNGLPDCQGALLGLAPAGRSKRAPSAYNLFLKKCASSTAKGGEGKDFRICSREWKEQKVQKR